MKIITGIAATTHRDSHGDRFTVDALIKNADDANQFYYPLGINHDPRIPPIGRLTRHFVVPFGDCETALRFEVQQFEDGDNLDLSPKLLAPNTLTTDPEIIYDNSFDNPASKADLSGLATQLGLPIQKQTKKAFEPLAVLILVLTLLTKGFFEELSKDLYAAAKESLARLLKRRSHEAKILVIRFKLFVGEREIQAEIFLSNPTIDEIGKLFELQRSDIEDAFKPLVSQKEVVKVAADLTKHGLVPRFALRRDGVPLDSRGRLIVYKGRLPEGFSVSFRDESAES